MPKSSLRLRCAPMARDTRTSVPYCMARAGVARTSKSLFTVGHHRINQIPVHPMPGRAQVIHVPESEKDLDLYIPFCAMHANSLPILNQLGSIFYSDNRW